MTLKLKMEVLPTNYVEWNTLVYASKEGIVEEGTCGLSKFLAQQMGREGEIKLIESLKGSHYAVTIKDNFAVTPSAVKQRLSLLQHMKTFGSVESWYLRSVLEVCVEQKWLPAGHYSISVS